jgi:hypothetical protein
MGLFYGIKICSAFAEQILHPTLSLYKMPVAIAIAHENTLSDLLKVNDRRP